MYPPHLPPPTCNLERHKRWQRLKIIFVAVFFGLLAGITGASVTLGWLWPVAGEGDRFAVSYYRSSITSVQLEEKVREEMQNRTIHIYSAKSNLGDLEYFDPKNKVGDAVLVSNDGWMIMYQSTGDVQLKNWWGTTPEGGVMKLDKIIKDTNTGIVYVKTTASTTVFSKPVEFTEEKFDMTKPIFVYQDNVWISVGVTSKITRVLSQPHWEGISPVAYTLDNSFNPGSLVINAQGKLVGFMISANVFVPSSVSSRMLPLIFSKQKIVYLTLGVKGWYAEEREVVGEDRLQGFLVAEVVSKSSVLKPGDIILESDNEIVDPNVMWYTIKNNKIAHLKVKRGTKLIELTTPVVEL
jgi:hypothetical protein